MRRIDTNSKNQSIFRLLLLLALGFALNTQAQVTIGSGNPPASGVLLDLKEWDSNNGGTTAEKGMKLPRVQLVSPTSLVPLASDDVTQKAIHKGTVVYNVKLTGSTMEEGIYYWDGTKWNLTGKSDDAMDKRLSFFHMPTFILDTSGTPGAQKTINLYTEYKNQFSNVPAKRRNPAADGSIAIFNNDELNYYVLGFDNTVLDIVSISDKGLLTYKVLAAASGLTYINIVFTVREK